MVIIPNQRKVVADLIAGRAPDPSTARGKQRSMHNNYLTLPVLFVMISNHYPLAFATRCNWVILAIVLVIGAVIRHFYNTRHKGRRRPGGPGAWPSPCWSRSCALDAWPAGPAPSADAPTPPAEPVTFAQVEDIVISRCSMCHAAEPVWAGIAVPPKGVLLDTPARIRANAREIASRPCWTSAMPPANVTEITAEEREVLGAWVLSGRE